MYGSTPVGCRCGTAYVGVCLFSGKRNVGVYAGYSDLYDGSASGYCALSEAKVDTLTTVGRRVMAAGACPNYGKVIAFTNKAGAPRTGLSRWQNEIHAVVMPHSTKGCAATASPGASEVPKRQEGFAMYAGYMTHCPFNSSVYEKDMLTDSEYSPTVCSFVTASNPLRFLDTTVKQPGLSYTPHAFHGAGGHQGYDYAGQTAHVGCPPYNAPKLTSPMKDSSWITDPFECSRLSSCTNHCWPFKSGGHCFRSLPAQFNVQTRECRLLGYHTQDYRLSACAEEDTSDESRFYCVRPIKTRETSVYAYITAHTRPDYATKCRKWRGPFALKPPLCPRAPHSETGPAPPIFKRRLLKYEGHAASSVSLFASRSDVIGTTYFIYSLCAVVLLYVPRVPYLAHAAACPALLATAATRMQRYTRTDSYCLCVYRRRCVPAVLHGVRLSLWRSSPSY